MPKPIDALKHRVDVLNRCPFCVPGRYIAPEQDSTRKQEFQCSLADIFGYTPCTDLDFDDCPIKAYLSVEQNPLPLNTTRGGEYTCRPSPLHRGQLTLLGSYNDFLWSNFNPQHTHWYSYVLSIVLCLINHFVIDFTTHIIPPAMETFRISAIQSTSARWTHTCHRKTPQMIYFKMTILFGKNA